MHNYDGKLGLERSTFDFLFQICTRLYHNTKRVKDPDMDNVINPHEAGQIIIDKIKKICTKSGRIIIDKDKKLIVPNAGEALDGPRDNTIWVRVDIEDDQVLAW